MQPFKSSIATLLFFLVLIHVTTTPLGLFSDTSLQSDLSEKVYFASFPRSGNTWIRNIIEDVTGYGTFSVYRHFDAYEVKGTGYVLGPDSAKGCLLPPDTHIAFVKTHYPSLKRNRYDLMPYSKVIRVVRNPIDSFFSYCKLLNKQSVQNTKYIPTKYIKEFINSWREFQEYWDKQPRVFTYRYEDILEKPYETCHDLIKTIGYTFSSEDLTHALTRFPARGKSYAHLERFREKDIETIKNQLRDYLEKYNYRIPNSNQTKK